MGAVICGNPKSKKQKLIEKIKEEMGEKYINQYNLVEK
jgi:hypothetical protein